ncbi:hypothetical protein JZU61_05280, partial [bacterium]|nr:hypothetical protein [bacterium]
KSGQSVKYADTSSMLSNRLKSSDTTSMLGGYARTGKSVQYADTSSLLSGYAKSGQSVKYADTASMLLNRLKVSDTATMLSVKAPLLSPAFTGIPTAPTAAAGTNNTQLATTAYADAAVLAATPAGTSLTGTTLASNITNSSLTSLGVLSNLSVTGEISANSVNATLTKADQPNVTSLGTLINLSVAGDVSVTGAVTATDGVNASAASTAGGIGYNSNGGRVTQTNNKSRAVTINAYSGQITTHNARLNGDTYASFVVNNSVVKSTNVPFIAIASGGSTGRYRIQVDAVTNGSFTITVHNITGNGYNDNIVINFVIFKGN